MGDLHPEVQFKVFLYLGYWISPDDGSKIKTGTRLPGKKKKNK